MAPDYLLLFGLKQNAVKSSYKKVPKNMLYYGNSYMTTSRFQGFHAGFVFPSLN